MRLICLIKVREEILDFVSPVLRRGLRFLERTLLNFLHLKFKERTIFIVFILKVRKASQKGLLNHLAGRNHAFFARGTEINLTVFIVWGVETGERLSHLNVGVSLS